MLLSFKVNAQMMVVKSDIMRDVALAPNLHVDFTVGEKHTLGLGGSYGNSVLGKDINIALFISSFLCFWSFNYCISKNTNQTTSKNIKN